MFSLLLLGKSDHVHAAQVREFCERRFSPSLVCLGRPGDPFPEAATRWTGGAIISYLSPWIVPAPVLARASRAAINFHPAPPEFPGIGCVNFALYQGAEVYGATCHHMAAAVDSGEIIEVRRFPVRPDDDVASLLRRAYDCLLAMFNDLAGRLADGAPLPRSNERWGSHLYTRRQLDALARIGPEMSADEVRRRVRATAYGSWRPEVRIHGLRFAYEPEPGEQPWRP